MINLFADLICVDCHAPAKIYLMHRSLLTRRIILFYVVKCNSTYRMCGTSWRNTVEKYRLASASMAPTLAYSLGMTVAVASYAESANPERRADRAATTVHNSIL